MCACICLMIGVSYTVVLIVVHYANRGFTIHLAIFQYFSSAFNSLLCHCHRPPPKLVVNRFMLVTHIFPNWHRVSQPADAPVKAWGRCVWACVSDFTYLLFMVSFFQIPCIWSGVISFASQCHIFSTHTYHTYIQNCINEYKGWSMWNKIIFDKSH